MARQRTIFQFAVEPNFRIELFQQQRHGPEQKITVVPWKFGDEPAKQAQQAMEQFGFVTARLADDSELLQRFNIVSIPLQVDWEMFEPAEQSS
jgi:hypothetical protein